MPLIKHGEVSFAVPSGWVDSTQPLSLGPPDGNFRPSFLVASEPSRPGENVATFAARHLGFLKTAVQGYALIQEGPASFGGNAGFLREHSFVLNGEKLTQLQLYLLAGKGAFIATFTEKASRMAGARRTAEQMFEKLQLNATGTRAGDVFG